MEAWSADHLVDLDTTTMTVYAALKVCEEAGELAAAVVKPLDGTRRDRGPLGPELADVVLAAATCAGYAGVDLAGAVAAKLTELEARPIQARLPM
jgi:NTP pyrophosphatase (non-canonical NTP hydrolase)